MNEYSCGRDLWIRPSATNCLPEGFSVGYRLKPMDCKRKRGHLQIQSPEIDFVLRVLNRAEREDQPEYAPEGNNFVETPCTCHASLAHALENRQCLNDPNKPHRIAPRHLAGYRKAQQDLTRALWAIIASREPHLKTLAEKARTYPSGKREHYEKCAREALAHPINHRERDRVFHDAQVKWGELSSRPRALLVQSVRAKGTTGVKAGELLRLPILCESIYREHEEDALHRYLHARGHHMTASGMSLHKKGKALKKMTRPGSWLLSIDFKNFDGTEGEPAVIERQCFLNAAQRQFGRDAQLKTVLETQNRNRFQAGPLSGRIYGNRGSGTAGTSTGNKKVVLAALLYAMGPAAKGKEGCTFLCDGDDTIIEVPQRFQELLPNGESRWITSWVRRLAELGFTVKVEQLVTDNSVTEAPYETTFCRARVIETPRGPFLCKKPADAMKVATNFRRHFQGNRFRDYLQTLSVSMEGTYGDVPILCEMGRAFDVGGRVDTSLLETAGMEYMMSRTTTRAKDPISESHRLSFWRSFNITPTMQKHCETALREFQIKFKHHLQSTHL